MFKPRIRLAAGAVVGAMVAVLLPFSSGAVAAEEPVLSPIEQAKTDLARDLRDAARDPETRRALIDALVAGGVDDPRTIIAGSRTSASEQFTRQAGHIDAWVKGFLGLPAMTDAAFRVYVADVDGRLARGVDPLFAAAPEEDAEATTLVAEDLGGGRHTLDLSQTPPAPVILINLNLSNITPQAMNAVSASLRANGVLSDVVVSTDRPPATPQSKFTRLDRIKLKDDHEPGSSWWCGSFCAAEIFVLAMGGSNGQPRVDVVPLYEVDFSGTTYFPNRVIINWQQFSWDKVDLLVMEKDATACQAPYSKYGAAVAGAIATQASSPNYVPLNSAARAALNTKSKICSFPLSWGVNPPDHVDSFNALTQGSTGTQVGVANNANTTMSLI